MNAVVCRGLTPFTSEEKAFKNRVQWDPERSARLGMLPYRSIQIGIGREMSKLFFLRFIFVLLLFNILWLGN